MAPRRDRISRLPVDILDHILGHLPIQEAAKTAILSTIWRDVWFSLTQLNFDYRFFGYICNKHQHASTYVRKSGASLHVINKVLLHHRGTIRKIVLDFHELGKLTIRSRSYDFDQWLLLVTLKGVEEIYIYFDTEVYKLPSCIFSCLTLKRLYLYGGTVEPMNFPGKLPNVALLYFQRVDFAPINRLGCAIDVPILETLSFINCQNIFNFNITAPKLRYLEIERCGVDKSVDKLHPINLDLTSISTLILEGSLQKYVEEFTKLEFQGLNVEYLQVSCFYSEGDATTSALVRLLQLFPKLWGLDIDLFKLEAVATKCKDAFSKLLEEIHDVAQTNKMLKALKLLSFRGSQYEILFIKELLASFSTLEKVVIFRYKYSYNKVSTGIMQELLDFAVASTKAEVIFV